MLLRCQFLFAEVIWKNKPEQQTKLLAEANNLPSGLFAVGFSEVHRATS
jgi:hypothetical protein